MKTAVKIFRFFITGQILLFTITAFLPGSATGQSSDDTAIRQLLKNQTEAWNKGNLDEFMKGYWQSDSMLFIGKAGPAYGYSNALNHYKKNYPNTAAMGKLSFNLLQVKRLSSTYYYVMGKWHLQRSAGNLEGYFTLLFQNIKSHWVIVIDHTS